MVILKGVNMPTLIVNYNWGRSLQNFNPELTRQLSSAYTDTANAVNSKLSKYVTNGEERPNVDPPATPDNPRRRPSSPFNKSWEIGDIYVRTDMNMAWIMTSRTTAEDVVWTLIT